MTTRSAAPILFAVRLLAVSLAGLGPALAAPQSITNRAVFEDAHELYRQGKWSAAYARFAGLADAGEEEAARTALLMLRHCRTLYGHEWGASQYQIDRWIALDLQRMKDLRVNADE